MTAPRPSPPQEPESLLEALGTFICRYLALKHRNALLAQENQSLRRHIDELSDFVRMAHCDPLTNSRNRRYFEERLAEEVERCARYPDRGLSLVVIDIDDFKEINDQHGHPAGDEVLRAVAEALRRRVRQLDVCCRIGGDEFAVILPDTQEAQCVQLVGRLPKVMDSPVCGPIGLSIGWATRTSDEGPDELLRRADRAMYRAKSATEAGDGQVWLEGARSDGDEP